MSDIEKSIKLYEMMQGRCAKSGFSGRQAKVYSEMVELMKGCATADEAAEKIKNSKYYTLPSAALLQDKLAALAKAAGENNMPEVANAYSQKVVEIEADINEMHKTGYEQTAGNIRTEYLATYQAFGEMYSNYFILTSASALDEKRITHARDDIKAAFGKLKKPSSDFKILATDKNFRQMVPASDAGYKDFVEDVSAGKEPDFAGEMTDIKAQHEQEWQTISANKEKIMETGKSYLAKTKQARMLAISPSSKTGKYTFEELV